MVSGARSASRDYELVGFVGDYSGDRASLMFHRPVVRREGVTLVALSDFWSDQTDLVELTAGEPFSEIPLAAEGSGAKLPKILPGQGVWLAGFVFANRCAEVDAYGNVIRLWPRFGNEFLMRVGDRQEFHEFSTALFHAAARCMARYLSSPRDCVSGRDVAAFEVLNHVHEVDPFEQAVERGVFYLEKSDSQRLAFVASDAVRDGLAESVAEFMKRVEARRTWIKEDKLKDRVGAPLVSVDSGANWTKLHRVLVTAVSGDFQEASNELSSVPPAVRALSEL